MTNLAAEPKHKAALEKARAQLDRWVVETKDRGPEAEKMYDSDMAVYVGGRANKGNGESDIDFYIQTSYFAGANATDYFYTYIKFGNVDTIEGESWESDGSFEELRVLTGVNPPDGPEPGTVALFGIGLIGLAAYRRK